MSTREQLLRKTNKLRQAYRAGKLPPAVIAKLEKEAIGWRWNVRRSIKEWVMIAEKIADGHSGQLPRGSKLAQLGYGALSAAIRKHPRYFKHIRREKYFTTRKEWAIVAEQLAARNKGLLPPRHKLPSGLNNCITLYPELFAHLRIQRNFKPFIQARAYVRSLNCKDTNAWKQWCKSKSRARDIPTSPNIFYKTTGWINWPDWFGQSAMYPKDFVKQAEQLAAQNGGKLPRGLWRDYPRLARCRMNHPGMFKHIPYHNRPVYLPFTKARQLVRSQKFRTARDFFKNRPSNVPSEPQEIYKTQWINWPDWLGNGNTAWSNSAKARKSKSR